MFLKITKLQLKICEEEIINLIGKFSTVIEFCATPLFCKGFKLAPKDKQELKNIIDKLTIITEKLNDVKKDIQSL